MTMTSIHRAYRRIPSIDVTVFRNELRANDVEFRGFEHLLDSNLTLVEFTFDDSTHHVMDHDYLLTVISRYLQDD
jgi:hypothetical protein